MSVRGPWPPAVVAVLGVENRHSLTVNASYCSLVFDRRTDVASQLSLNDDVVSQKFTGNQQLRFKTTTKKHYTVRKWDVLKPLVQLFVEDCA